MERLVSWVQGFALALGGPGLFIIALLDSSFLSFPEVVDLLIVVYVTGNGLKTQEALVGALSEPYQVRASLASVEEALGLATPVATVA